MKNRNLIIGVVAVIAVFFIYKHRKKCGNIKNENVHNDLIIEKPTVLDVNTNDNIPTDTQVAEITDDILLTAVSTNKGQVVVKKESNL